MNNSIILADFLLILGYAFTCCHIVAWTTAGTAANGLHQVSLAIFDIIFSVRACMYHHNCFERDVYAVHGTEKTLASFEN